MVVQGLPPGMQYREKPDIGAQMLGIACHGQEGLRHGLKEEVIHHPWVLERQWAEEMREGKHHMDVGDVEQIGFTSCEPRSLRPAWTRGAMPIPAGVRGELAVPTLVALRRVSAKRGGPADCDGAEGAGLLWGQGGAIPRQIGGTILAHYVSDFERRAVHRGAS